MLRLNLLHVFHVMCDFVPNSLHFPLTWHKSLKTNSVKWPQNKPQHKWTVSNTVTLSRQLPLDSQARDLLNREFTDMTNKEKGLTLGVHFALGKRQLALI